MKNEKNKVSGFSNTQNMANFEELPWALSLVGANLNISEE